MRHSRVFDMPRMIRAEAAYACANCLWTCEGTDEGRCRMCGSSNVFPVAAMIRFVREHARLLVQKARIQHAEVASDPHANPTLALTDFRQRVGS